MSKEVIIDLHLHTTASDGTLSPEEVVQQAASVGAHIIALTDHDTMTGVVEAATLARELGLELIPGVELNTDAYGVEVDILGYFLNPGDVAFQAMLQARQQDRVRRARDIIVKLNEMGIDISYDRVQEIAHGVIARPHIAQAMIEKGYAETQKQVYQEYIGLGAPAYVERDDMHPEQAIQYVRRARGVPVIAHPGLIGDDELVIKLLGAGAAGLEAYYPEHSPEDIERYQKMAGEYGAIVTAGTDCHGPGRKKSYPIGSMTVPPEVLFEFKAYLQSV